MREATRDLAVDAAVLAAYAAAANPALTGVGVHEWLCLLYTSCDKGADARRSRRGAGRGRMFDSLVIGYLFLGGAGGGALVVLAALEGCLLYTSRCV